MSELLKPIFGPELDKIINDLRLLKREEKNKYLVSIYSKQIDATQILDKIIIDIEYDMKKSHNYLKELREKRELFTFYDSY